MLGTPVAKIIPQYQTSMTLRAGNYCLKGSNFPKLTVLNIECKFMLLKTILDHYKLVNWSIGTVKGIYFKDMDGPKHIPYKLTACVIVEFKQSIIAENRNGELI